ncbi:hypothetical protein BGZ58_006283, partial [Dissophora ornata]
MDIASSVTNEHAPPSSSEQGPAHQDDSDNVVILDPASRGKIEQLVLEALGQINAVLTTADGNTAEDSIDEINDTPINGAREVDSDADNDPSGVAVDTLVVGGVSIA